MKKITDQQLARVHSVVGITGGLLGIGLTSFQIIEVVREMMGQRKARKEAERAANKDSE